MSPSDIVDLVLGIYCIASGLVIGGEGKFILVTFGIGQILSIPLYYLLVS